MDKEKFTGKTTTVQVDSFKTAVTLSLVLETPGAVVLEGFSIHTESAFNDCLHLVPVQFTEQDTYSIYSLPQRVRWMVWR